MINYKNFKLKNIRKNKFCNYNTLFSICDYNNHLLYTKILYTSTNYFHTSSILKSNTEGNNNVNDSNLDNISCFDTKCNPNEITNGSESSQADWLEQFWNKYTKVFDVSKEKAEKRLSELEAENSKDPFDSFIDHETSSSTFEEDYPWFVDSEGNKIDFNKKIKLFDGISLTSRFLETFHKNDNVTTSKLSLSEILKIFEDGKDITVLELYNHIANIYGKDPNLIHQLKDQIFIQLLKDDSYKASNNSGEGLAGTDDSNEESTLQSESTNNNLLNIVNASDTIMQPLGQFGEITLNQILLKYKELKWEDYLKNVHATANTLPVLSNFIGYNLLLRSYVKHIHNRPYKPNLSPEDIKCEQILRRKLLFGFVIVGAPFILMSLKFTAIHFQDLGSIEISSGSSDSKSLNDSSKINTSGFLGLIFFNLKKKLKEPMQIIFILLSGLFIIFKLLGYNLMDITNFTPSYFRLFFIVTISLKIIYDLTHLTLLYVFYKKKKVNIPQILPDFIINWLKDFKIMTKTQSSLKRYKNIFYIELFLYSSILILIIIVFF